jgi:hypothetical protein
MSDGNSIGPDERLSPTLRGLDLAYLCGSERFRRLDKLESYYRCTQYDGLRYDWNGNLRGYGGEADIRPGWYVPLARRRPSARFELARLIVQRFSAMVFGAERFPQLVIEGDEEAQDYLRELAREARLMPKLAEARNKGGAQGSACMSFGFVDGKPRLNVHNAKHVEVLRWADRYLHRPAEVLEAYSYPRTVYGQDGKPRVVQFYFARYWSETEEILWDPIPEERARGGAWVDSVPSQRVAHEFGFCPFYWAQNRPESESVDGDSDFEGLSDKIDEMNILLSATSKGTVANVDPTLVVKDDPINNTGKLRKGSENAIYSKGGAEYLELRGDSLKAALSLLQEHKDEALDTASVVLARPEMASKATSAAALRVVYMPMINAADVLREQYGQFAQQICTDMLRAARLIIGRAPGEIVTTADGQRLQRLPTVVLGPKYGEDGTVQERVPGTSEAVTLNWPPYFPNTWSDTKSAVEAIVAAAGAGTSIISRRTAVENIAAIFGIADVDQEIEAMDGDAATKIAFAQQAFAQQGDGDAGAQGGAPGDTQGGRGFQGERQDDGGEE